MADLNGINSVNSMLEQLGKIDLNGTQASDTQKVRDELTELFTNNATFNEGGSGAAKISTKLSELEAKIKDLQAQAAKIYKQIEEKNGKIGEAVNGVAATAANITKATAAMEEKIKEAAIRAANSARLSVNPGESYQACFDSAYEKELLGISGDQQLLKTLYQNYKNASGQITDLSAEIDAAMNDIRNLQGQARNVESTISILTRTKNIMEQSNFEGYKNVDTDNNKPIYSGAKAEVANAILSKYNPTGATGSSSGLETTGETKSSGNPSEVQKKWTDQKSATYSKGDKRKVATNPELKELGSLIEKGMLTDLANSGMSNNDIMNFVSKNWNVNITQDKNGAWKIPKGHGDAAKKIFNNLNSFVTKPRDAQGAGNSVNPDNMQKLKDAVEKDGVLTKMYEAGFTFKEAMNVMAQAFPDSGLEYDATKSGRSYKRVSDTAQSGNLYSTIGNQVLQYWNVKGEECENIQGSEAVKTKRCDPMTFQKGNTTYTFTIDRNMDGIFDYASASDNELLGSNKDDMELLKKAAGDDGVLTAEEAAAAGIRLMANTQNESVGSKSDVDKYKKGPDYTNNVKFDIGYTSLADFGIESLDVNKMNTDKTSADASAVADINGSKLIENFDIKMKDGSSITGSREDATTDYLDVMYGQVAKNENTRQQYFTDKVDPVDTTVSDQMDTYLKALEDMKNNPHSAAELAYSQEYLDYITTHDFENDKELKEAIYNRTKDNLQSLESTTNAAIDAVDTFLAEKGGKKAQLTQEEIDQFNETLYKKD